MRRGCAGNGTCGARRSTRHVPVQVGGRDGEVEGAGLIAASLGQGLRRAGLRGAWHGPTPMKMDARGRGGDRSRRASARHSKRARDKTDARPAAARRACARVRPLSGLQFGMRAPSPSGGHWQNPPCVDRGFPMGHDRQSLKAFRWALRTPMSPLIAKFRVVAQEGAPRVHVGVNAHARHTTPTRRRVMSCIARMKTARAVAHMHALGAPHISGGAW